MEREYKLGLSDALKRIRKEFIWPLRGKVLRRELRYAWQRAWYGFDEDEVQNLGENFAYRMSVLLRAFKKNYDSRLRDPETLYLYMREETIQIIDKMIHLFDNCEELSAFRDLHGVEMWEDDDQIVLEHVETAQEECARCRKEALKLFSKFCFQLWHLGGW